MRLDKYITTCVDISRKDVKKLIKQERVSVNSETARRSEMQVDENSSVVEIDGERIVYRKYVYLMLNKPKGYISATYDKHYPVVTELVGEEYAAYDVFPAGRLDIDTEGLLIMTNDGELAHRLTSPSKNVYKRYFAILDKPADEECVQAFSEGMEFKEFTSKPAKLEITKNPCEVYIEIAEGKFHQVKRMCERVGRSVEYLKRVKIGGLALDDDLMTGEIRPLTEEEIQKIFK